MYTQGFAFKLEGNLSPPPAVTIMDTIPKWGVARLQKYFNNYTELYRQMDGHHEF